MDERKGRSMSRKTVSMIGNLTRDMMSDVMETSLKKPIQTGEFRKNPVEPAWRCPAEYIYELVKTEQFVMEYLKPKQAVTGRVILQLHGGGYIGPMKNIYRRFAVKYSQISFGADVLTPDYRVAPEHPYPAALEDAVYAYRWLLEEKKYQPSQIVVAGDSAGGGLALALCLYAKDHGLPLPAGIITMSPWTDVSLSGASYEENYTIDPLFGNSKENMLYQCSYIGNANPKNPYLSPLFGDFEGFPPMLMQVGAYEVLLDDTRAAAKKARAEGVKVRCSVYDGMFHVFQMGLDLIPESREAWEEVAEYLRIIYRIHREPEGTVVKKVKTRRKETEDRATGKPLNQITKGEWYVRGVQHVDEANEVIYFSANGMKKGEDPYLIHYYKINFDGSNLVELTPEEGMHQCWYSSDYKYLVDVYSKVDQAPIAVLRDAKDGKIRMQLDKADISALLANGWKAPEVFSAKGRDGKTDMWGVIYRPSNFDPSKKYPVIEYIYSGPGDQYVPKTFSSYNWWMTSLAELGFIVVQVDGMTTSFRSKEFEEVCYKNLKDAGLPDHIAWIKAAAQKYPYMDIDRVGIFGCSAGGQESTGAVLFHPEFYKAACSACGCHDNRMDKIWWNELWMGYPIDESYSACSNVDNAHLLSRPLMLVVGELDDNVDPASTMQVANALIKANKDFELVVIPGAHHTMGEDFGEHKRYDFFVRHLMGVTPPSWDKVKTGK